MGVPAFPFSSFVSPFCKIGSNIPFDIFDLQELCLIPTISTLPTNSVQTNCPGHKSLLLTANPDTLLCAGMLLAVLIGALTFHSSICPLCCKVHGVRDNNVTLLNNNITNADNDATLNYFSSLPAPWDTPNLQKYYIQKTLIILD